MIANGRATLLYFGLTLLSILLVPVALLVSPLPYLWRYLIIGRWTVLALAWLKLSCGLSWRVSGKEYIPTKSAVVLCKHQSALETLALMRIFPPQVWVLKRGLLFIPFLGWALALLKPIAINRGSAVKALKQTIEKGKMALAEGHWVIIFPEGTRVPPGQKGKYNRGGAKLAIEAGVPVIPVAVNTGLFWGRNSFAKKPGITDIVIGAPIITTDKSPAQVTQEAEDWIEANSLKLLGR